MIATKMVLKVLEKCDKISPKLTCNLKKIGRKVPGRPKSSSHRYGNLCPYMPLCGNLRRAAALLEILAEVCGV
jgi:hypothetical protein